MSFILDALKKSETERQQNGGAEFATVPAASGGNPAPRWLWLLVALLLVNLAVLAGLFLRSEPRPEPVAMPAGPAPNAGGEQDSDDFSTRLAAARDRLPVEPPATAGTRTTVITPAPADTASNDPATPAATAPPPVSAAPDAAARDSLTLPTFDQLRAGGILNLPDLHLDIHVYSDLPGDRFVFVNMTKHRENSRLAAGPRVVTITPEGVVLEHQGTRFLLPRE